MNATFNYEQHVFKAPEIESIVKKAVDFFSNTPIETFPPQYKKVYGAGVYGLYYFGDYEPYAPVATANKLSCSQPIYVGKAVLPGNRTGLRAERVSLLSRLRQHSRSIQVTHNLKVEDFKCRFIFLDGIEHDLIATVETGLIRAYRPLWNSRIVDGFGNHDVGSGRYEQQPSAWDTLHPGRAWVSKLTGTPRDPDAIKAAIKNFLEEPKLSDLIEPTDS